MKELYKQVQIDGFAHYSVSNFGNVMNIKTGRILTVNFNQFGMPMVALSTNGKTTSFGLNRLVVKTFILRTLSEENVVSFINGNKSDCRVENLQVWENIGLLKQYLLLTGKTENPNPTEPDKVEIVQLISDIYPGVSLSELARLAGLSKRSCNTVKKYQQLKSNLNEQLAE